ncbi:hypothetical protein B5S32_g592 [[Candida] boidinii]|nr:hypothetical protein B5S32_g592 [[Candida] boidinii]
MSAFNDIYTLHNIRSSNKNNNLKLFKLISKHIKFLINNELSDKNKFISNSNNIINDFNKQNNKLENSYEIWNDLTTEYNKDNHKNKDKYNNNNNNDNNKFDARIPNPYYKLKQKSEPIINGTITHDNESDSESSSNSDSDSNSDSESDSSDTDSDSESEDSDSDSSDSENDDKEEKILSNKEHERQFEIIKEGYEIKPINTQIYENQFLTYNQIKSNNFKKSNKLINSNIIYNKISFINYNINNLNNVLQICLLRNDFKNAYFAFSLIIRLPGVDIREIWPIGLEILKNLNEIEFIDILNESIKENESESESESGSGSESGSESEPESEPDADSTSNKKKQSLLLNNNKSLRKSPSPTPSTSNNSDTIRARRKRERIINNIPINNLRFLTLNKNKNLNYFKKFYSSNITDISFNLIKNTIQDENRENLNKILKFLNWINTFYSISYFSFSGIYPEQVIPDHLNPKYKLFKKIEYNDKKSQLENGDDTTNGELSNTQSNSNITNGDSITIPDKEDENDNDDSENLKELRMSNNKSILWRSGTKNFVPMYIVSLLWELIISGNTAQCMSLIAELTFNPPFDTDPSIKFCLATCKYIQLITILVEDCFDPEYNNQEESEVTTETDSNDFENGYNKDYHKFNIKSLNWVKIQDCNQLLTDCKKLYKQIYESKFQFPYRKIKLELDKISKLLNQNNNKNNNNNKNSNGFNKEQHRKSNKRKLSFNTSNLSSDDDSDTYIKSRSRHNSTSNNSFINTKTILEEEDLKSDDSRNQEIDDDYDNYNIFNSMSSNNNNNKKAKHKNDYLSQINNNDTMPSFVFDEDEYDDRFEEKRERNPDSEFEDD